MVEDTTAVADSEPTPDAVAADDGSDVALADGDAVDDGDESDDDGDGADDSDIDADDAGDGDTSDPPPPLCPLVPSMTPSYPAETLTFRQGLAGYDGTVDLHVAAPANALQAPHAAAQFPTDAEAPLVSVSLDATRGYDTSGVPSAAMVRGIGDQVGLLAFHGVIGHGSAQVPPGVAIDAATLTLHKSFGDTAVSLHRAKSFDPWTRWEDLGATPGPQPGEDFDGDHRAVLQTATASKFAIDVAVDVQSWADGASDNGWALLPRAELVELQVPADALGKVAKVRVGLQIKTKARGDLIATLHHGDYHAVLLNRIGRWACDWLPASDEDDINVLLDDDASTDVHKGGAGPLVGTYRPDASCLARPLCGGATKGFCGQPASGRWTLQLRDEFSSANDNSEVAAAWLEITDSAGKMKIFDFPAGAVVPTRQHGEQAVDFHSSEAVQAELRPSLEVTFPASLRLEADQLAAVAPGAGVETGVAVSLPASVTAGVSAWVGLSAEPAGLVEVPSCPVAIAGGGPTWLPIKLVKPGKVVLTASSAGLQPASMTMDVGSAETTAEATTLHLQVGQKVPFSFVLPRGASALGLKSVVVASADPQRLAVQGGASATVPLSSAVTDVVTVELTALPSAGGTTLSLVDPSGIAGKRDVAVQVANHELLTMDWLVEPFWTVAEAEVDNGSVATLGFQTTVRSRGGPAADYFQLRWRDLPNGSWKAVATPTRAPVGDTGRLGFRAQVQRPPPGLQRQIEVQMLRDGVPNGPARMLMVPPAASAATPWTAVLIGNHGFGTAHAASMIATIANSKPDLLIADGDTVYDRGEWQYFAARGLWPLASLAKSAMLVFALGNHDTQTEKGAPMVGNLRPPANGPPGLLPGLNYSFDFANARFFVVDTSTGSSTTPIGPWLLAGLKASPKAWNIVVSHELPYTHPSTQPDRQALQTVRQDVLVAAIQGGADLMLGGACHSYQRYLPATAVVAGDAQIQTSSCDAGPGVPLVYAGNTTWFRPPKIAPSTVLPAPLRAYLLMVGHARLTFDGDTLTIQAVDAVGKVHDTLKRKRCTEQAPCSCP